MQNIKKQDKCFGAKNITYENTRDTRSKHNKEITGAARNSNWVPPRVKVRVNPPPPVLGWVGIAQRYKPNSKKLQRTGNA